MERWDGAGFDSAPLLSAGYSNATLTRLSSGDQSFVVKHTDLRADWIACRTNDARGREALLLSDETFRPVWDIFACPYIAYAIGDGEIELLMHDLTDALLPDARAPLSEEQETAIVGAIARMHACYWGERAPACDWLVRTGDYCDLLPPSYDCALPAPLRDQVRGGWTAAMARVPPDVAERLTCPGREWARLWDDLPKTLLHGDVKVANFALTGGRVAAFDWALAGVGPCSVDLGWYLAVNASRLAGTKEELIARYRSLLGMAVDDTTWQRLETAAIVSGARMLLWSKALALEASRAGAAEEWDWWMERLRA